jgi:hypothetical protein
MYFEKTNFSWHTTIDNYFSMSKQAKTQSQIQERYINMIVSIIYIYVSIVTVYMTIFFFTLTTNVAHGDVNISNMM